jgi:hypothetical protein
MSLLGCRCCLQDGWVFSKSGASPQGRGRHLEVGGIPSRSTSSSLRRHRCLWGGWVVSKPEASSLRQRCCCWGGLVTSESGASPRDRCDHLKAGGSVTSRSASSSLRRCRCLRCSRVVSNPETSSLRRRRYCWGSWVVSKMGVSPQSRGRHLEIGVVILETAPLSLAQPGRLQAGGAVAEAASCLRQHRRLNTEAVVPKSRPSSFGRRRCAPGGGTVLSSASSCLRRQHCA